jgi:hypothetical protein
MSLGLNLGQGSSGKDLLLPEQTNLNTWLTQPSTDGKTLTNVKGTDATLTGINALTFNGSDAFIQANNTGLGAGNFYYETIFKFDWSDGNYIVFDGDSTTNNRWFALQYRATSRGLNFVIDGDGTKTTYEIFSSSEVSDNDIVKIVVKREGSTITSQGFNLTQDSSTTDTHTSSSNFSGGNKLTIGALWSGTASGNFAELELYSFKAGTSETDLLVHYPCAEGNGTIVYDISGQGNNATITNATRTTETSSLITAHNHQYGHNNSASFKVTSLQYLDLGADNGSLTDTSWTLDARIKFNVINQFTVIFSQNANRGFLWRLSNSGQFQLFVGGAYVNSNTALSGLAADRWIDTRLEYNNTGNTFTAKAKLAGDSNYTTLFSGSRAFQSLTGDDGVSVSMSGRLIFGMKENVGSGFVNHFDGEVETIKVTNNGVVLYDCASAINGVYNKITKNTILVKATSGTDSNLSSTLEQIRVPALINKTKQGYTADGVADEIEFNHSLNASSDFEFESEFIVNDPSLSLQAVFSATGSTTNDRGMFIRYEASNTRWLIKLGDTTYYISSHSIARGDVYKFNLKYHSSTQKATLTMTKNGTTTTPIDNQSVTHVPDFNGQASLGSLRWSTSSPAGFTFKTCKFIQGTTTNVELDIANSAGLSTVADLSGNGNNGALQSATISLNWGKRYTDSSGDIVTTYYSDGNTDVTNPSGFVHNNSECGLDLITSDKTAGNIQTVNNTTATQTFVKGDQHLATQILQYSSALSDAGELARTRAYVS